jgi:hypothetical protein
MLSKCVQEALPARQRLLLVLKCFYWEKVHAITERPKALRSNPSGFEERSLRELDERSLSKAFDFSDLSRLRHLF